MPSSSSCTRTQTALTSDCNSLCPVGRPCVAYAAGDERKCLSSPSTFGNCTHDAFCVYECFAMGPRDFAVNGAIDFSTYTFLIPFSTDVKQGLNGSSEHEMATGPSYPSKSNTALQHIEPLDLLKSTTNVVLAGGSSVFGVRGKVAKVQLPPELLIANSHLKAVTLANLGLEQLLVSSLPSELVNLTISNCLMTSYPTDLQTMDKLEYLDLSANLYAYFPADIDIPNLQTLNLSANYLASFEGVLPRLTSLDIAHNNLTSIPSALFRLPHLRRLNLRGNPFTRVTLTPSQLTFLQQLDEFQVDSFGDVTCNSTTILETANNNVLHVCVTESKPASNKAFIAGIMAASIVLCVILALIFICRCLRRRVLKTKLESDIIHAHRKESSPIATPGAYMYERVVDTHYYLPHSDDNEPVSHPQGFFPSVETFQALHLNAHELDYIRKLETPRPERELFLTTFRRSRYFVCKRLHQKVLHETAKVQEFAQEIHLAASLEHPRIVALAGITWSRSYGLEALFEYMEGGNVRSYLEKATDLGSWRSWKLQIALDTAEALAYAHSFAPALVHGALSCHNLLLSSRPDFHAHLDTFIFEQSMRDERCGPPEVITNSEEYSSKSDMYAFGWILSELDTHVVATGTLQPSFTHDCPARIRDLAERCLHFHPSKRPTAREAVLLLRTMFIVA